MLGQILLGDLKRIKDLPELPGYENPTAFFELFVPMVNLVQSTASIFQTLLNGVPIITDGDLIEWGDNSLYYFDMYRSLMEKFNIEELLETRKVKKIQNFYNNVYTMGTTMSILFYPFLTLHKKFGGDWDKSMQSYNSVPDFTLASMQKLNLDIPFFLQIFLRIQQRNLYY